YSIVRTMRLFPRITLEIRMCFSDSARAEQFGKLDRQRAAVVRDYLIRRGIAPTRMRAAAGGGRYPLITENWLNQIPEASQREYWRRYNERLEFVILNPAFE